MISPPLKSILLVDDDEISNLFNRIFISKLDLGIKVDIALNGEEALEFLNGSTSNGDNPLLEQCLLLLDIRMPIMDGWAFLEAYDTLAEEIKSQIVIVMLTTSEDEGDLIRAVNSPYVKEVIKKPLSEIKFNTLIEKFFKKEKSM